MLFGRGCRKRLGRGSALRSPEALQKPRAGVLQKVEHLFESFGAPVIRIWNVREGVVTAVAGDRLDPGQPGSAPCQLTHRGQIVVIHGEDVREARQIGRVDLARSAGQHQTAAGRGLTHPRIRRFAHVPVTRPRGVHVERVLQTLLSEEVQETSLCGGGAADVAQADEQHADSLRVPDGGGGRRERQGETKRVSASLARKRTTGTSSRSMSASVSRVEWAPSRIRSRVSRPRESFSKAAATA